MQKFAALVAKAVVWLCVWPLLIAILAARRLGLPLPSWAEALFSEKTSLRVRPLQ
jgi:hypothetical protein